MGRLYIAKSIGYIKRIALALFCLEDNYRYRIDVIITPDFESLVTPDDETKKMLIPNLNILAVNWYLCKILPPLTNKKYYLKVFRLYKHDYIRWQNRRYYVRRC